MAKALRKTLPKDLAEQINAAAASGDYTAVHTALAQCSLDARGGYGKGTALHLSECTPELAQWLVARGVDVNARDTWGYTALHESARARCHRRLSAEAVLALGGDVHATASGGQTPLHSAADGKHLHAVEVLLRHGARADARTTGGLTPLEYALQRMSNIDLVAMVPVAEALLRAGDTVSPKAQDFVHKAAVRFDFHRPAFNADAVEETAAACLALCTLFAVTPPTPRRVHDGVSPIVAQAATWQAQHAELWDLLVPSMGACATVQGEVIRIAGRVSDELYRNGGGNWDADHRAMLKALAAHLASQVALDTPDLNDLKEAIGRLPREEEATRTLARLAVAWVARNPQPVPLPPPGYRR